MSKTDPSNVAAPPHTAQGTDNDHDNFIRGLLSITILLIKKLKYVLPVNLQSYVKFDTLKPTSEVHVDNQMIQTASDCIYECEMNMALLPKDRRSKRKVPQIRFVFLMEAKSSPPSEPVDFQIEGYRKEIWSKDLKNKRFPGLVLPILIYNGKVPWNRRMIYDRFKLFLPEELLEYVPFYKYLIINLFRITNQEIIDNVDLGALRSAFLALKHGHDPEYLKQEIANLFNFAVEDPDFDVKSEEPDAKYLLHEFLKLLSAYIQRRTKMTENEVMETILKSKNQVMATKVRTMFDIAEERGEERGIAKGIALSEEKIKQAEAKAKETEAKAKETEAKAKETEAKIREIIKILMLTTAMTNAQLIQQFQLSETFVMQLRKEITDNP
jgi:Putative transposase, YhgA-like